MSDNSIQLGPYSQGEIPEPVTHTFLKSDGTPDGFTPNGTFVAKLEYRRWNTTVVVERTPIVAADQAANAGQVTWSWVAADIAAYGDFEGELWVGNGTNRYRSQRFRWLIKPSVAVPVI
jgi:hypothetical protein